MSDERVAGMVDSATRDNSAIFCHSTLYGANDGNNAVCRGFFDRHATVTLRLASAMGVVEFVELEKGET